MTEVVLLVEDRAASIHFRPVILHQPNLHTIYERCHLSPSKVQERVWFNIGGERAPSGQRIFREAPQGHVHEEGEAPVFDELHVKIPFVNPEFNALDRRVKQDHGKPIKHHHLPPELLPKKR